MIDISSDWNVIWVIESVFRIRFIFDTYPILWNFFFLSIISIIIISGRLKWNWSATLEILIDCAYLRPDLLLGLGEESRTPEDIESSSNREESFSYILKIHKSGVADLFHFDLDPIREITDPDPAQNPTYNRENINFCFTFFSIKKYIFPKYDRFCYLWGKYLCQYYFFKKIYFSEIWPVLLFMG